MLDNTKHYINTNTIYVPSSFFAPFSSISDAQRQVRAPLLNLSSGSFNTLRFFINVLENFAKAALFFATLDFKRSFQFVTLGADLTLTGLCSAVHAVFNTLSQALALVTRTLATMGAATLMALNGTVEGVKAVKEYVSPSTAHGI